MKQSVTLSDLSAAIVPDDDVITLIVKQHPALEEVVALDAGEAEVKPLLSGETDYVLLDLQKGDKVKSVVVDLTTFNAVFTGDPYQALMNARRVKTTSSTKGTKRSKEELDEIRTWAKANGWPDLKDRGRIPQEVEDAYNAANPAA